MLRKEVAYLRPVAFEATKRHEGLYFASLFGVFVQYFTGYWWSVILVKKARAFACGIPLQPSLIYASKTLACPIKT